MQNKNAPKNKLNTLRAREIVFGVSKKCCRSDKRQKKTLSQSRRESGIMSELFCGQLFCLDPKYDTETDWTDQ